MSENFDVGAFLKDLAEAESKRAEAEKLREETRGIQAVNDHASAVAEADLRAKLIANKKTYLEAEADLHAKQISNEKARTDAEAARTDKLIEQLTRAVPDLSSLNKNTVTFGAGKALRQGEVQAKALGRAARDVAQAVKERVDSDSTVFVTSEPRLVAALAAYWQLRAEADLISNRLVSVLTIADDVLAPTFDADAVEKWESLDIVKRKLRLAMAPPIPGVGSVVASVAGAAFTQAASLLEMDVAVTSDELTIPASVLHAAVIHELLSPVSPTDEGVRLTVQHQWMRIPAGQSVIHRVIHNLLERMLQSAVMDARLKARIEELGDPAATLAVARKTAADSAKSDEERDAAKVIAQQASRDIVQLEKLTQTQLTVAALLAEARLFVEGIRTVAADSGVSPLAAAISIEPLASFDDGVGGQVAKVPLVLVVGDARSETNQIVVTRRIAAPRLQISSSVDVEYYLVQGSNVLAAGHAVANVDIHALIRRWGTDWKTLRELNV